MAYPLIPLGVNNGAFFRELNLTGVHRKQLYMPRMLPNVNGSLYNSVYLPLDGSYTNYGYAVSGGFANDFLPSLDYGFTQNARRGMAAKVAGLVRNFGFVTTLPADFSVSIWFQLANLNEEQTLYVIQSQTFPSTRFWRLSVKDTGSGYKLRLTYGDGISGVEAYLSNADIELGIWNHLVFCDNDGSVNSYLNGELDSSFSYTRPGFIDQQYHYEFFIGTSTNDCLLDEVSYWLITLQADDVAELYNMDNKDMAGRDKGYWYIEREFHCRDTHIFGGGQRSSIEKLNLGREMTSNDRLIVMPRKNYDVAPQDLMFIEGKQYEVASIQNAGGLNHHLQVFCKAVD